MAKEKMSLRLRAIIGIALFTCLGLLTYQVGDETSSPKTDPNSREGKIEQQFSTWDGAHRNLEKFIKANMKDPNSYEHVETRYSDNGDHLIVVTTYRGTNSFGGVVTSSMKAKVSVSTGQVLEIIE